MEDLGHTESPSKGLASLFDSRTNLFRAFILVGACFLTFGSYYSYDIVGALSPVLINPFYGITNTQESLLYAVYSLPNMVLPFLGGFFVDSVLGVRFGGLLFGGLVFAGQTIWAISGFFPNHTGFWIAVFGRFVFGLGGESLSVTQSTYCGKWFPKEYLTTVFGVTLAFARIGSAINFLITPFLGNKSIPLALWFGVFTCLISVLFAAQLAFWDWRAEKITPPKAAAEAEKIRLTAIFKFKYILYILIAVCIFFYISVFVFLQNAVAYFVNEYYTTDSGGYYEDDNSSATSRAGIVTSVPYFVAAVAAPTAGILIQKTGYMLVWLAAACALNGVNMLVMLWAKFIPPIVPMFFVGISYSTVAASLWPCIPAIVKPTEMGTAYGLFFSIQNFGLFLAPILIGKITSTGYYTSMMLTFSACAFCACILTICVIFCDKIEGTGVNASAKELRARRELQANEKDQIDVTHSLNSSDYPGIDYD